MYDVVKNIIDHVWQTQTTGDQQIIYYICGCLIVLFAVVIIDLIYRIIGHFWR